MSGLVLLLPHLHFAKNDYTDMSVAAHPEERILEKESVLMILPSMSIERKVGAHGCRPKRQNQREQLDLIFPMRLKPQSCSCLSQWEAVSTFSN